MHHGRNASVFSHILRLVIENCVSHILQLAKKSSLHCQQCSQECWFNWLTHLLHNVGTDVLNDAQVVLLCIFLLSPSAAPLPHAHLTHTQLSIPTPSHHTPFLPTPHTILHHSPLLTPSPYSITPHSSYHTPSLPTPHDILHHSPLLTPAHI